MSISRFRGNSRVVALVALCAALALLFSRAGGEVPVLAPSDPQTTTVPPAARAEARPVDPPPASEEKLEEPRAVAEPSNRVSSSTIDSVP